MKNKKTKAIKSKRQRRLLPVTGYTATEAQLAEIMLLACSIRHNATEMHNNADRMCRIADKIDLLRATIRNAEAV